MKKSFESILNFIVQRNLVNRLEIEPRIDFFIRHLVLKKIEFEKYGCVFNFSSDNFFVLLVKEIFQVKRVRKTHCI